MPPASRLSVLWLPSSSSSGARMGRRRRRCAPTPTNWPRAWARKGFGPTRSRPVQSTSPAGSGIGGSSSRRSSTRGSNGRFRSGGWAVAKRSRASSPSSPAPRGCGSTRHTSSPMGAGRGGRLGSRRERPPAPFVLQPGLRSPAVRSGHQAHGAGVQIGGLWSHHPSCASLPRSQSPGRRHTSRSETPEHSFDPEELKPSVRDSVPQIWSSGGDVPQSTAWSR